MNEFQRQLLSLSLVGFILTLPAYMLLHAILKKLDEGQRALVDNLGLNSRLTRVEERHALVSADVKRIQLDQGGMSKRVENQFRSVQAELEAMADRKEKAKSNLTAVATP